MNLDYVMFKEGPVTSPYSDMVVVDGRYLSKVGTPLSEVALLLGYAEQSAFNHAFKRWTGVTPKVWREKNAALGATPW